MNEDGTPQIPGYRLLERLGRGAAGVVYLAEADDDLARQFAIKVFPPDAAAHYARELATLREVEGVRRASSSRDLLEVVHAGDAAGRPFVVMEYCSGGDLLSRVRSGGPLDSAEALRYLIPVLRALELLHEHGWVHKDVKPANVLLGDDGFPRLGDFGLTRTLDGPLSSAGTPGFCAPEVYRGGNQTGSGVLLDVYSVAATLYFVLTGDAPLPGRPDVFPLERRRVPRPLQRVLLAGLKVDPEQRVASASAFRELLERVQRGEDVLGKTRFRRPWAVLGAVVLLAGAALGWGLHGDDTQRVVLPGPTRLELAWSSTGALQLGDGPKVPVLDAPPARTVADPTLKTFAAVAPSGAIAVLERDPLRVVCRIPPPARRPTVLAVATDGKLVARLWASSQGPPRLELFALPGGARLASCVAQGLGEALLLSRDETGDPRVVIGTLGGDVVIQGWDDTSHRIRSHGDSISDLWCDTAQSVIHVRGDDRELSPRASGDEVRLPDGRGLAARPSVVTRSWDLPALLEGRARLLGERAEPR